MNDSKKILVIDDDVDTCMLLSRFLGKKRFTVAHAYSGKAAKALLSTGTFDLILYDFGLGDIEGTEMLSEIKKISPGTPVIIITGYSDIRTAVNVIKSGAYDYVAKPLIPDEILHTIKRALSAVSTQPATNGAAHAVPATKKAVSVYMEDEFIIGESSIAKELNRQISLV